MSLTANEAQRDAARTLWNTLAPFRKDFVSMTEGKANGIQLMLVGGELHPHIQVDMQSEAFVRQLTTWVGILLVERHKELLTKAYRTAVETAPVMGIFIRIKEGGLYRDSVTFQVHNPESFWDEVFVPIG